MPRHFLQWFLLGFIHFLTRPRLSITLKAPPLCSVENMVPWMTFQDLGTVISEWAAKEGQTPVTILHLLENSLATSQQVHFPGLQIKPVNTDDSNEEPLAPKDLLPPAVNPINRPFLAQPPDFLSGPPVNVLPPPPNSHPGRFLPFGHNPPLISYSSASLRQPLPNAPVDLLRPPPEVIVRIDEGAFGIPIPPMPIIVSPRMTVTEALEEAAAQFEEEEGPLLSDTNFYKVNVGLSRHPHCRVIREVGNISVTRSFVWVLTINDNSGKEIWKNVCLPSPTHLHVQPGMVITLNYVSPELLEST